MEIEYKSLYSKLCDEKGISKPTTQEEEDYCQSLEFESPEWCAQVLSEIKGKCIPASNIKSTWRGVFKRLNIFKV